MWRWDQGRLDYFRFDEIKGIAKALVDFEGQPLPAGGGPETLRRILQDYSSLPFAPQSYTVWRNYGRVFGAQLLAAKLGTTIGCTDLCHAVAAGEATSDDYMLHLANRFYYPSPVFEGYDPAARKVFPISAIIKLLLARSRSGLSSGITVEDVESRIIGNNFSGTEPTLQFQNCHETSHSETAKTKRQIRELMVFVSQISFLKWDSGALFLDADSEERVSRIDELMHPYVVQSSGSAAQEIINLGSHFQANSTENMDSSEFAATARIEFKEGSKVTVTHLKIERNSRLRQMYFASASNAEICDMCALNTAEKYPWTNAVIDIHHLLPLSSPIRIGPQGTSLHDVVGLCPSCHRATHRYYGKWLSDNSLKDFRTYDEARGVYVEAKNAIG